MRLVCLWDLSFTQLSYRLSFCFGCCVPGDRRLGRLWIYNNNSQAAHLTRGLFDSEVDVTATFQNVCKY